MSETKEQYNKFETWAMVEIMGHQRYAGLVTEQVIAGSAFLRVDVPEFEDKPAFTKLFSPGSVYAITPCAECVARAMSQTLGQQPITIWDLPEEMRRKLKAIEARPAYDGPYEDDEDDNNC